MAKNIRERIKQLNRTNQPTVTEKYNSDVTKLKSATKDQLTDCSYDNTSSDVTVKVAYVAPGHSDVAKQNIENENGRSQNSNLIISSTYDVLPKPRSVKSSSDVIHSTNNASSIYMSPSTILRKKSESVPESLNIYMSPRRASYNDDVTKANNDVKESNMYMVPPPLRRHSERNAVLTQVKNNMSVPEFILTSTKTESGLVLNDQLLVDMSELLSPTADESSERLSAIFDKPVPKLPEKLKKDIEEFGGELRPIKPYKEGSPYETSFTNKNDYFEFDDESDDVTNIKIVTSPIPKKRSSIQRSPNIPTIIRTEVEPQLPPQLSEERETEEAIYIDPSMSNEDDYDVENEYIDNINTMKQPGGTVAMATTQGFERGEESGNPPIPPPKTKANLRKAKMMQNKAQQPVPKAPDYLAVNTSPVRMRNKERNNQKGWINGRPPSMPGMPPPAPPDETTTPLSDQKPDFLTYAEVDDIGSEYSRGTFLPRCPSPPKQQAKTEAGKVTLPTPTKPTQFTPVKKPQQERFLPSAQQFSVQKRHNYTQVKPKPKPPLPNAPRPDVNGKSSTEDDVIPPVIPPKPPQFKLPKIENGTLPQLKSPLKKPPVPKKDFAVVEDSTPKKINLVELNKVLLSNVKKSEAPIKKQVNNITKNEEQSNKISETSKYSDIPDISVPEAPVKITVTSPTNHGSPKTSPTNQTPTLKKRPRPTAPPPPPPLVLNSNGGKKAPPPRPPPPSSDDVKQATIRTQQNMRASSRSMSLNDERTVPCFPISFGSSSPANDQVYNDNDIKTEELDTNVYSDIDINPGDGANDNTFYQKPQSPLRHSIANQRIGKIASMAISMKSKFSKNKKPMRLSRNSFPVISDGIEESVYAGIEEETTDFENPKF